MRRVSTRVLPDPAPGDDQQRPAAVLDRGPLRQRQVVEQCSGATREGTGLGGGAPAAAASVVGSFGDPRVLRAGLGAGRCAVTDHRGRGFGPQYLVVGVEELPVHSHSIVPGGFDVTSSATRFTPSTSLMTRDAILSTRS